MLALFLEKAKFETQGLISSENDIRLIQLLRMLMQVGGEDAAGNYALINYIGAMMECLYVNAFLSCSEKHEDKCKPSRDINDPKETETLVALSVVGGQLVLTASVKVSVAGKHFATNTATVEIAEDGAFQLKSMKLYIAESQEDSLTPLRDHLIKSLRTHLVASKKVDVSVLPVFPSKPKPILSVKPAKKRRGLLSWCRRNKGKAALLALSLLTFAVSCVLIASGVGSPLGLLLSALGCKGAATALTATIAVSYGACAATAAIPAVAVGAAEAVEGIQSARRKSSAVYCSDETLELGAVNLPSSASGVLKALGGIPSATPVAVASSKLHFGAVIPTERPKSVDTGPDPLATAAELGGFAPHLF